MKKHRVLGIGVVMIVSLVLLTMLGGCASWFRGGETIPIAETKSLSPIDAQVEKTESQSVVKLGPVGSLDFQLGKTDRYALVVGNGAYEKTTKLANPVNDAGDVADMLSDLGFKVRLETNTTLSRMEGAVREFSKEARDAKASTTLFFYAGHGVQYEGINYLLPVDADIQRDYELRSKALAMDMVASALEDTKSGFNLVMHSEYEGARFSDLFQRQRQLPFGSKLQNHALNHRLNEEFKKYFPTCTHLPIIRDAESNRYWINENLIKTEVHEKIGSITFSVGLDKAVTKYRESRASECLKMIA